MPLDKDMLATKLKETFQKAKDEEWESDQVADALADAINDFVKSGDVTGITTEVRDAGNNIIGSGAQTGTGDIE